MQRFVETARFVAGTYRTLHGLKSRRLSPRAAGERLARDATAMGPLYVKMAQFVSARRDVLDAEFVDALAVVQDSVPLGDEPEPEPPHIPGFVFESVPIGRASIADVYVGRRLADDARVVVKRRRPGVKDRMETDLPLLVAVMGVAAAARCPGALNMLEMIRESQSMVLSELDFELEARSQMEFRALVAQALPWVVVPRVIAASGDTMVSEFVPSRNLSDVATPSPALATRLMDLYMTMLDLGFVHADPHPGNLGVLPGGRVVLYDFGAMLRVHPDVKTCVARLLRAGVAKDAEGVMSALEAMEVITVNHTQRVTVRRLVRRVLSSPDMHSDLQNAPEFVDSDKRVVRFGQTFVYLARTLSLMDASCRSLDPEFKYDYEAWVDPSFNFTDAVRDVAGIPAAMHTMQQDMEEFQTRIVSEIDGGKRASVHAAAAAALFFFLYILHP